MYIKGDRMDWINNETIFYVGIGFVLLAFIITAVCFSVLKVRKVKLDMQLEKEYGESENKA
jgi:hypothetical protein